MIKINGLDGWQIKFFETVESTMDTAKSYLNDKTVIWANCQTLGRGRLGKNWISKSGNLFCSLVIKPEISLRRWNEFAFLTALAVGETIENFIKFKKIQFKWPNDILIEGQKISGILLEIQEPFIIIGIGINIVDSPELNHYKTIYLKKYVENLPELVEIITDLIRTFQKKMDLWHLKGFQFLRETWLQKAASLNCPISIKTKEKQELVLQGIFSGIDEAGNLLLKLSDGTLEKYHTGEIFLF